MEEGARHGLSLHAEYKLVDYVKINTGRSEVPQKVFKKGLLKNSDIQKYISLLIPYKHQVNHLKNTADTIEMFKGPSAKTYTTHPR